MSFVSVTECNCANVLFSHLQINIFQILIKFYVENTYEGSQIEYEYYL
jgi:hypothetical protein